MLPILLGLGAVAGIVGLAIRKTMAPAINPEAEKNKLIALARKNPRLLTLDQAEDGLVLARRYGNKTLTMKFAKIVLILRKQRISI